MAPRLDPATATPSAPRLPTSLASSSEHLTASRQRPEVEQQTGDRGRVDCVVCDAILGHVRPADRASVREFFGSFDHQDGALIVKLDEERVDHLLAIGQARRSP